MQTVDMSRELCSAINTVEKLLNGPDAEFVLKTIRDFKRTKQLDDACISRLSSCLRK